MRDLYRDRVNIEREYAAKLQLLARKAADKKARKIAALVVGHDPIKPAQESTIRETVERTHCRTKRSRYPPSYTGTSRAEKNTWKKTRTIRSQLRIGVLALGR